MIDIDSKDRMLVTLRNCSRPEIEQILSVLLLDESDYHQQLLAKLDPRITEKEHFVIRIGYFDPYTGDEQ
jgi:hypothetical protein